MAAICLCCAHRKAEPLNACPSCSFLPRGRDRAISWLYSDEHLSSSELEDAALRIAAGDPPNPSSSLVHTGYMAIGVRPESDSLHPVLLVLGNLLLTPLFGLALWLECRHQRPEAASALARTSLLCATFSSFVFVVFLLFSRW